MSKPPAKKKPILTGSTKGAIGRRGYLKHGTNTTRWCGNSRITLPQAPWDRQISEQAERPRDRGAADDEGIDGIGQAQAEAAQDHQPAGRRNC
jgi:hypothetical protein